MWHLVFGVLAITQAVLQADGIRTVDLDWESELESEGLQELVSGNAVTEETMKQLASSGAGKVHSMSCDDFEHDMVGLLERLQITFDTFGALHNSSLKDDSTVDLRTKIYGAVADEFLGDSLMVSAIAETAHRKKCLSQMYASSKVQAGIRSLLDKELEGLLTMCDSEGATTLNCRKAWAMMVQWQNAAVKYKNEHLFDDVLTSDIKAHCPHQCEWCSRQHRSKYKKNEPFRFKCYINKTVGELPSGHGITCEKPRRRTITFWKKKTWCEVKEWKQAYIRRNKVAALFSCSLLVTQPTVQERHSDEELKRAHRACMRVEQGIVVMKEDMDMYKQGLSVSDIKTKTKWEESVKWATRTLINLGLNAGMAELIRLSTASPAPAPPASGHALPPASGHALLEGDPHPPAADESVIEVFTRGNPVSGGEDFFNEELEEEAKYEVCHIEARWGQGVRGLLSQFFRQAVRIPLLAVGVVIHAPLALVAYAQLLMLAFEQSFFVGLVGLAGSPLLLAAGIAKTTGRVWNKVGRLLRIADWDCDPSKVTGWGFASQCIEGMYFGQERAVPCIENGAETSSINLKCDSEHDGAVIAEGTCNAS